MEYIIKPIGLIAITWLNGIVSSLVKKSDTSSKESSFSDYYFGLNYFNAWLFRKLRV